MNIALRRALAPAIRATAPGYSACHHCGWPWTKAEGYSVTYREEDGGGSFGIFVACTKCWPILTPEEKIRYTSEVVNGTGTGWRWNQSWDAESAHEALWTVAREAGARTEDEVIRLIRRAFPVVVLP